MSVSLIRRRGVAALIIAVAATTAMAVAVHAQSLRYPDAPTRIDIQSSPIEFFDVRDPSRQRFGLLEFRGGLVMTAKHRAFGGISGLLMRPNGSDFVAITDNGAWLRGRIAYRDGRPSGIVNAEIAPLLDNNGKPLAARGWFDAESIAQSDGTIYVGIERVDQIVRFNYGRDGFAARGQPLPQPPDFKTLTFNRGLECLVVVPKSLPLGGSMIAVTENSRDDAGNLRSFILNSADVERFSIKRRDDYDVSDCAILPPADLVLLERRYSRATGVAIRLRRVALSAIQPSALADGSILMEADMGYQIDNMEGLAIHRNAQDETILTLISDDNFSPLQRNILLQFALIEP